MVAISGRMAWPTAPNTLCSTRPAGDSVCQPHGVHDDPGSQDCNQNAGKPPGATTVDELDKECPHAKAGVHNHGPDEPQFGEDRQGLTKVIDHTREVAQTARRQKVLDDE